MKDSFHGILLASLGLLLTAIPVLAHHTIAAEFDTRDTVTLQGVFTKIDWINPHIYFHMDVKDDSGNVRKWSLETYPTGFFHRAGITEIYSSSVILSRSSATEPKMVRKPSGI